MSTSNTIKCEGCGNTTFVRLTANGRTIYPYIEILHKDRRGFKAKRTNLSVFYDEDYNVKLKENMVQILKYDLINHKISLYKNGVDTKLHKYRYEEGISRFFTNVDDKKFKDSITVAENESLYDMAWVELSKGKSWSSDKRIYRGLVKLFNYTYLQILSSAGFPNVNRFKENQRYYNTYIPTINVNGTNPKDIFGVPKFVLNYIREDDSVGIYEIKQIKEALEKVEVNRFKELLGIVKDESTVRELCQSLDTLVEIHDTYGYNNIKKLTLYLFREVRMNQGIGSPSSSATLLRDYIRMSTKLGQEFEKYPKSLKKEHDITQMNYKVKESAIKQKEFNDTVTSEEYKAMEYKKKEFTIVSPSDMSDLIKEGNDLSHCISSYTDRILNKKCKIFFMRKTNDLDSPLISIEVANENIRQARGYANRKTSEAEKEFIAEWAKKKGLVEAYYY